MEAMFELLDTKPQIVDAPDALEFDPTKDGTTIEFDGLEFGYPGASVEAAASSPSANGKNLLHEEQLATRTRPILQKTTCTIQQGKTVAIVGSSG